MADGENDVDVDGPTWHRVGDRLEEGARIHANLGGRPVCIDASSV